MLGNIRSLCLNFRLKGRYPIHIQFISTYERGLNPIWQYFNMFMLKIEGGWIFMWCKSSQTSYTDVFHRTPHPDPTVSKFELAISKQSCPFFCIRYSKVISPGHESPWKPLTLRFSPQAGGTVRCGRLRDQPRPPSLLRSQARVRPPAGTAPLQLCGTLSKIQTHLPLQGLPTRPGGAVQRLFIEDGKREELSGKKTT